MKKVLLLLATAVVAVSCAVGYAGGTATAIPLNLIHTDGAFRQFKWASKVTQTEIINEFLRQANASYKKCTDIEEVRELRENVVLIDRYIKSAKRGWNTHFLAAQKDYNLLFNKINKTIREYEGGTTVYNETGGYYDTDVY